MSRQLKDWGIIAANGTASISVRVWDRAQTLVGIFTVTCPQVATLISGCAWSGAGWSDNYLGAEVVSITNGDIFTGPVDDITKLTTTSGEKLVVGYGLGISGLDDQSKTAPFSGGGGGGTWGSITGTLSAQTDLQAALDAKANVGGSGLSFGQALIIANLGG